MPALVESMMYVREVPWHGLGVNLEEAPTSKDAIKYAELDWRVESKPIYDSFGKEIKGFKANTRDKDNSVLGIVSDRYKIVQNDEAFEFTDSLIEEGEVRYETAGSLKNGKQIWLLAKMPETKILDDKFDPYICFTNAHDGTGAIKVACTPIRVVCNNTLNIALASAKRSWSTRHMGNLESKLIEAKETLGLANEYMKALDEEANRLTEVKITDAELEAYFDALYPIDKEKDSPRKIKNILDMKENLFKCYNMPDISTYKGNAWGVVNAITDMADHISPSRMTKNYKENNWGRIINGHPFVDGMYKKILSVA